VFLRFQLMRGLLNQESYKKEIELVKNTLETYKVNHWQEFLAAWG
jgi:3'-5' exonuclease